MPLSMPPVGILRRRRRSSSTSCSTLGRRSPSCSTTGSKASPARRGLLGSNDVAEPFRRSAVIRTGLLAIVATLPLIPDKLFFLDYIEKTFDSLTWIGAGFLVTAVTLFLTHRLRGGEKGPRETTFLDALLVGVAQMFAPLPGVSRSGLTISAALALGFSKTWAVGFSLMMAVLAVSGATVFEIRKVEPSDLDRRQGFADRRSGDRGGSGRLPGHRLARSACPGGAVLVFFCIPDPARSRLDRGGSVTEERDQCPALACC